MQPTKMAKGTGSTALACLIAAGLMLGLACCERKSAVTLKQPSPNAKIGDPNFDTDNDGEFNAVDTVEALPEEIRYEDTMNKSGTVANVSVICGDGPDHGRTFWVVNVWVNYKDGHDQITRSYQYDIQTGLLTTATTRPTP
jgi:hypothetical protein